MNKRMTIGMFTDSYLPEINGVVTSIASAVNGLRRRGHRVVVFAPAHEGVADRDPDVFRFRSVPFPFYQQIRMAFPLPAKLLLSIPQMPFDVIHAHSLFFVGCLGAFLAGTRRIPLAFTYHTRWTEYAHYLPWSQNLTRAQAVWISREFCNRCTEVIAPTRGMADMLAQYGVTAPVAVIPTGVDLDSFRGGSPDPAAIRAAAGGPIVLYAGRLGKEKNLDVLLDAFALLAERIADVRLYIAGCGPYEDRLKERAATLPCAKRMTFLGALDKPDLGSYYRAADVFAFASTTETQGLVLAEAIAHGVPVAAVDCPVSREIIGDDTGLLATDDASALCGAIADLLAAGEDERARRRVAAIAAAEPFANDKLVADLEALYVRCMRARSVAADL
jgi:1,2-diacylglycerol 3-alpha-glucosyltransferase